MQMQALDRYLQRYAEPDIALAAVLEGRWQRALITPVYREPVDYLQHFLAWLTGQQNVLWIVVLNRPDSDADLRWTESWWRALQAFTAQRVGAHGHCYRLAHGCALLLVDHTGNGLPRAQGVGLARKIGADIACALLARNQLTSPWLYCTDADALLPADYFAHPAPAPDSAALIFPFQHIALDAAPAVVRATRAYEFRLRHYVAGLRSAGSPWAFHSIGSTLAVHAGHYAAARGFPRRAGGEDFYLLNKLAKLGAIISLPGPRIALRCRESSRAPFGTGPAVTALLAEGADSIALYHPAGFRYLRAAQQLAIAQLGGGQATPDPDIKIDVLECALDAQSWRAALRHCLRQGKTIDARLRHWHIWFDGFRSLKLLHWLRDHHLGSISLQEALADSGWRQLSGDSTSEIERDAMLALAAQLQE